MSFRTLFSILAAAILLLAGASPASANKANEILQKMSESERSAMLERYLHQTGEKCDKVTRTFFQGVQKETGAAFWNVGCRDKNAYTIMINNDAGGTTKIVSCAMIKAVGAGECFKKL